MADTVRLSWKLTWKIKRYSNQKPILLSFYAFIHYSVLLPLDSFTLKSTKASTTQEKTWAYWSVRRLVNILVHLYFIVCLHGYWSFSVHRRGPSKWLVCNLRIL